MNWCVLVSNPCIRLSAELADYICLTYKYNEELTINVFTINCAKRCASSRALTRICVVNVCIIRSDVAL